MTKLEEIQRRFGRAAAEYAASPVHARGYSLQRIVDLLETQPTWRVLDVATGAGHTALALASHAASVIASDVTPEMLVQARGLARDRDLANLFPLQNDARVLPFAADTFDLVTCRLAPHHFGSVDRFVAEAARVLNADGILAVADNVVPETHLRGKKRRATKAAAEYINAFEQLRDPSHERALGLPAWKRLFAAVGLKVTHAETFRKEIDFDAWTTRMRVSEKDRIRLRAMLIQAPELVQATLTPQIAGDRITFWLTEAILLGRKAPLD